MEGKITEEVTKTSRAWLLDFGDGLQAAVGHHEMWQVLISPVLFEVPCTPPFAREVLVFQERILPVLDVYHFFSHKSLLNHYIVGIAVYQNDPEQPIRYGCLHLASMPQNIIVSDSEICELPEDKPFWEPLALSSFSQNGVAVPIINVGYWFSGEFQAQSFQH